MPVKVITQTSQSIARAGRVISQVAGAYSQAKRTLNQARTIAPFLPDFGLGGLLDSSAGDSRVQKCYADLVACQKSGETIDIQTGINLYKNMLIQSVAVNQSQDGSATFTITAREIFIVETQTAQSKSSASGKSKSGRSSIQSATKSQQGSTQPKNDTPKRTSSLFNLFKW
ncbi:hypothetical protein MZA12_05415 [Haemophilus influenzae]|nr:hypothetical protein [Haemophilus influenzae]